jgi:thiamine transport system ATP-binding protein
MLELTDRLRKRQGLTVLLVTHDPADAGRIAGRTAFVAEGRVALLDETGRVLDSAKPEIRAYLGDRK